MQKPELQLPMGEYMQRVYPHAPVWFLGNENDIVIGEIDMKQVIILCTSS